MNQRQAETELSVVRDVDAVESVIKAFWERARHAATLITQLREEKTGLSNQLLELDKQFQNLRSEFSSKETEMKRLRAEHAQLLNANGHDLLTGEERDVLKSRIRDLIAKLNSHL